jgi:hypothetical protein
MANKNDDFKEILLCQTFQVTFYVIIQIVFTICIDFPQTAFDVSVEL